MMYSIEVFGAFDFLPDEIKIGTFLYERVKGNPSYRFSYDEQFLHRFPKLCISADLGQYQGEQSAQDSIFACFGDSLPERWGKALIDKREMILAAQKNTIPRKFDDFGYLVRIDDYTRMGAFRFKINGSYIGVQSGPMNVPPITGLEEFIRKAHEFELAEKWGKNTREEWIENIWKQGSSLGGARPKANVIDSNGELWIAKIPSVNDDYDIALWENFAHTLARKAGIKTAETTVIRNGPTSYHTLLSKRFDRIGDKRVHFASSLTLSGLHDGDGAANAKGYVDIVDTMAGNAGITNLEDNTAELYRRVAFNILIGNHDDHFRNHGFLLRKDGWKLSPAYDLNPTNEKTQSLMISGNSNLSSLKELASSYEYYLLDRKIAENIIREVVYASENWRECAKNAGISATEWARFAQRIDSSVKEGLALFPKKNAVQTYPVKKTEEKEKNSSSPKIH